MSSACHEGFTQGKQVKIFLRFLNFLLVSALSIFPSAQAATLEVQGIRADWQMRIQAPAGCGQIRSWYGQREDMDGSLRNSFHRGLDVVALAGTPVRAAAPGKVIYQERQWAGGNSLLIWHGKDIFGNRVISYYAHLQEFRSELGKKVKRGEIIGLLGGTGNNMPKSGTPHLHFEVLIYPEEEPVFRFGWLRNFTTVSPNYFYYPLPKQSGERGSSDFLPWQSEKDYGDFSGFFTGFTFPLVCDAVHKTNLSSTSSIMLNSAMHDHTQVFDLYGVHVAALNRK